MFTKQGNFTKKPTDLPNTPSPTYSASEIKEHFQQPAEELKTTFNKLIDDLGKSTSANDIGAKLSSGTASTIQTAIEERALKSSVTVIENQVSELEQTRATVTSVASVESRTASVENRVTSTESRLSSTETVANSALNKANSTQAQVNTLVISGDSSVEAAQARVDAKGTTFPTLQARLNDIDLKMSELGVNVKTFGAVGDGVTDDTQAIKNALASNKNIYFPPGRYLISVPNVSRQSLRWFTDESNIQIIGNDAVLVDANTYDTASMVNIFAFTRCKNVKIKGLNYEGKPVSNPSVNLNNLGTTFAYFEDRCENIQVEAELNNIRYGVRSGDYLEPSYGYCKNLDINITGKMLGYPTALYLVDNADIKVDVDGVHRAVYLAGVHGANVDCSTKNSYGATIQVLMTNSITTYSTVQSEQRARGCKFIKVRAVDTGSTVFMDHASLVGIALQWVAQGTEYSDIDVNFNVRSSDTVASKVAGFHLSSTAKTTYPDYPFNWEPYISIKNLKITGTIDRTGQTVASNQAGEIWINAFDSADTTYAHCPTISNLTIDNVVINKGTIQSRALYIETPNLQDVLRINNLQASGIDAIMQARSGKVIIANSNMKALSVSSTIADLMIDNSFINGIDYNKITKISYGGLAFGLANSSMNVRQLVVSTNGSNTYTFPSALKKANLTKAVIAVLPGYKDGGTWSMGITGNTTYFGTNTLNNSNGYNRFATYNYSANVLPKFFDSDKDLIFTFAPSTAPTTGHTLSVFIFEEVFNI